MHIAQTEVGVCSMVIAKDGMYPKETPLNGKGKLTSVEAQTGDQVCSFENEAPNSKV